MLQYVLPWFASPSVHLGCALQAQSTQQTRASQRQRVTAQMQTSYLPPCLLQQPANRRLCTLQYPHHGMPALQRAASGPRPVSSDPECISNARCACRARSAAMAAPPPAPPSSPSRKPRAIQPTQQAATGASCATQARTAAITKRGAGH